MGYARKPDNRSTTLYVKTPQNVRQEVHANSFDTIFMDQVNVTKWSGCMRRKIISGAVEML
jgi:hypothetical protein